MESPAGGTEISSSCSQLSLLQGWEQRGSKALTRKPCHGAGHRRMGWSRVGRLHCCQDCTQDKRGVSSAGPPGEGHERGLAHLPTQPQGDHRSGQATSWARCQPSAVAPGQSEGKEGGRSSSHSCMCTPPGASTEQKSFCSLIELCMQTCRNAAHCHSCWKAPGDPG